MDWNSVTNDPKAKTLAESSLKAIEESIRKQKEVVSQLQSELDLRDLLRLSEIAADVAFQTQSIHHAISLIRYKSRPKRQPLAAKLRLTRLASKAPEPIKEKLFSITMRLCRAEVQAEKEMLTKMVKRVTFQEKAFKTLLEELEASAQNSFKDFDYGTIAAIRSSAERNHDDSLQLYFALKAEGQVF